MPAAPAAISCVCQAAAAPVVPRTAPTPPGGDMPSPLGRRRVPLPEQTVVDRASLGTPVAAARPADGDERTRGAAFRQAEPGVQLAAYGEMQLRQRRAQPDGATREQHVLHRREQRLELRCTSPRPAG